MHLLNLTYVSHTPFTLFLVIVWAAIFPVITRGEAQLWGNSSYQALAWIQEKPASLRARQLATDAYFKFGQYPKVVEILRSISRDWPVDSGSHLILQFMRCLDKDLGIGESEKIVNHLKTSTFDYGTISALRAIADLREKQLCQRPSQDYLVSLLNALLANPHFRLVQSDLYYILGNLYMADGNLKAALNALEQAQEIKYNPYIDLAMAQWLSSSGFYTHALTRIDRARESTKQDRLKSRLLKNTLDNWEKRLQNSQKATDLIQKSKN